MFRTVHHHELFILNLFTFPFPAKGNSCILFQDVPLYHRHSSEFISYTEVTWGSIDSSLSSLIQMFTSNSIYHFLELTVRFSWNRLISLLFLYDVTVFQFYIVIITYSGCSYHCRRFYVRCIHTWLYNPTSFSLTPKTVFYLTFLVLMKTWLEYRKRETEENFPY